MDQFHDMLGMLDLMQQAAFCVEQGIIIKVNSAAAAYLINVGTPVDSLLQTGSEEYGSFDGGCLYLTLSIAGHSVGASVSRLHRFDIFTLEQDGADDRLQAMALAAQELREPLSNVMAVSDRFFAETAEANEQSQEQISRINRGLYRMLRIIGNMSDAGTYRADTGARQEIRDICAVLEEIFRRAILLTDHTGVTLRYTGYPESVYTLADTQKLERAVFNLLSNAIKFTPTGGEITAKLTRRGMRMYLSVCDNGSGIADQLRSSMFSRYTRQPAPEDSRYGLGIGMLLVRITAALHGGTVLVDHPTGGGTRVTVSFAIRQGDATLRSPRIRVDYAGERDHGLIELSDVLPAHLYESDYFI